MKAKLILFFLPLILVCFAVSGAYATLQDDVDQAVSIIDRFDEMPETAIPPAVMRDAKGLAIITITKAGFIVSGRGGTGIVISRTESGWSGPSAIGTGGIGVGFQAGMQVSEYVIVLNTQEAINAFAKGGNVTLGAETSRRPGSGRALGRG